MGAVLTPKEAAIELWQTDEQPVVDHDGKLKRTYSNRIYTWINSDVIRSVKVGNRYFIPRSAIDEL
jgi:hypothetical protein